MSKQLTFTGYVLQESSQFYRPGYFIYNNSSNNYEHFIERYYRRNCQSGKVKQAVLKEAQAEWKKLKANPAELQQYLELQSGEQPITRLQAAQPPKQVRDFGFYSASGTVTNDECVLLDEATSSSVASSLSVCSATFPSAAVAIVDKDKYLQDKRLSQIHRYTATEVKAASVPSGKRERPSIIDKFPQAIECATSFIKQHGYSAHVRWRTDTGNVSGVTLAQIRDYLLQQIPGLKEHGLGHSTVAYLMVPPQQKTLAAERYKSLIKV